MSLIVAVAVALVGWWFVEKRRRKTQPVPAGYQADISVVHEQEFELYHHLDALEAKLVQTGGPWILGEAYSLADVSWMAIFERLRQVDTEEVFFAVGRHPACRAYWSRMKARASYREAITQQDHPLIEYGTCRIREVKAGDPVMERALERGSWLSGESKSLEPHLQLRVCSAHWNERTKAP